MLISTNNEVETWLQSGSYARWRIMDDFCP